MYSVTLPLHARPVHPSRLTWQEVSRSCATNFFEMNVITLKTIIEGGLATERAKFCNFYASSETKASDRNSQSLASSFKQGSS